MLDSEQQENQGLDVIQYVAVVYGITEILEIRLFDAPGMVSHYSQTYIGRALKGITEHHNAGDAIASKNELARFGFLLKHIREIKAVNPSAFAIFLSELLKCMSAKEFFGLRMEIYSAASLTRAGVNWEKQESPDLKIISEGPLFVECGSAHLEAGKSGDALYKVGSTIAAKGKKPYANNVTALFIDITNVMFHQAVNGLQCNRETIRSIARDSLEKTNYGAALLFQYINDRSLSGIRSGFFRIDNISINRNLLTFLDRAYPVKIIEQDPHYVMPQG